MWRSACAALATPHSERAWDDVSAASPPDSVWHSLRNCVAYQAGVWQSLLLKGVADVAQPAAFKLAMVLRHTPSELTVRLLAELLRSHPQSQDLTSYILALLTDDSPWCSSCREADEDDDDDDDEDGEDGEDREDDEDDEGDGTSEGREEGEVDGEGEGGEEGDADGEGEGEVEGENAEEGASDGVPLRDLQLFGDCELAVLAASRVEYDAHAKRQRAEYAALAPRHYVELRIKMLNQLVQAPKVYQTPEFECFEGAARENVEREICTLREHLLTGRHD